MHQVKGCKDYDHDCWFEGFACGLIFIQTTGGLLIVELWGALNRLPNVAGFCWD